MTLTPAVVDWRHRFAVALDCPTLDQAADLAARVAPHFGVAKVGLELFSGHGPAAVDRIASAGLDVFLDVKLHDIPNTVAGAARQLGRLGASYVTVHASGGVDMIRAAAEGLADGADRAGLPTPTVLAVTVLTSLPATTDVLADRASMASEAGAGGIVCAVSDLGIVTPVAPDLLKVTPGIRLPGGAADDQVRVATPASAIEAGAGLLVIGRVVTQASDPAAVAVSIVEQVTGRSN